MSKMTQSFENFKHYCHLQRLDLLLEISCKKVANFPYKLHHFPLLMHDSCMLFHKFVNDGTKGMISTAVSAPEIISEKSCKMFCTIWHLN